MANMPEREVNKNLIMLRESERMSPLSTPLLELGCLGWNWLAKPYGMDSPSPRGVLSKTRQSLLHKQKEHIHSR